MERKNCKGIIFILILIIICPNIASNQLSIDNNSGSSIETINIAFVGDILMTKGVQKTAQRLMNHSIDDPYKRVASGFEGCFSKQVIKILSSANLTFGNLEIPIAEGLTEKWSYNKNGRPICEEIEIDPGILYDDKVYKHNPGMIFNAHPALAYALKNIGFDVVSTANNHYANRASNGIDKTIDALRKANLSFVGTIKYDEIVDSDKDGYPDNKAFIVKEVKGIKVAFLAFASQLNHIVGGFQIHPVFLGRLPPADEFCSRQVFCALSNNSDISFNIKHFCESINKAKNESDIVVVSLHAGIWNRHNPSMLQKKYIKYFTDAGADIITGSGPHVLQSIEKINTNNGKNSYVFYSLGNFIVDGAKESTSVIDSKLGGIGFVEISNDSLNGIKISDVSFTPTFSFKKKDGNTQVVLTNKSYFKKTKRIVDIVMNGTIFQRFLLSQYSLSNFPLGRILIRDDIWPDHWIFLKWKFEEIRDNLLIKNIFHGYQN